MENLSPSNSNVKNFIDETEKVVLGACLRIPENIPIVLDSLSAEDFFSSRNRIIFSTIKILSEKGALINPLSLSVELRVKGNTISTSEILEIEDQYIDGLDLNYHIGQLKMFSKRKKLENFLVDACQKVQDFSIEYPELEENIVQKIMSILNDGLPGKSPVPPSLSDISNLDTKVEWFVDKLIPKQAITVLHGKGGIGKTWIMLQIGSCVADGKNFMGLKTQKMPSYYIDFENSLPVLHDRASILGPSNLLIWHESNPIGPLRLDSNDWFRYKGLSPGLLIFDTLRASQILDENSSKDMAFVMGRLKELRDMGFSIVLIHHTPKSDEKIYKGSTATRGSRFL